MHSGKYTIDGHKVTVGHYGDTLERCKIGVQVHGFINPLLIFDIPDATPQNQLAAIVLAAIAARGAIDDVKYKADNYAQNN